MAAAAVVPLLAYGAWSIVSLRSGAQQAVIQGNLDVARRVAEQIELYVTSSIKILNAVSADLQQTGLEHWQQDRILKNFVLQFPEFTELTILDENGRAVVSSRLGISTVAVPGSDSVSVQGALLSRFSVDDDLLPTSVVAVRLEDNVNKGWLVGRLNLEELWRMVDRIRVGSQGYALVVTGEGQLLAHGDPDEKSRVARGDKMLSHPLIVALAQQKGQRTASAEYADTRGAVLGVAAALPTLGWTVIVEQPQSEAFAIPIALQQQLGIAITLALLAMLVAGYYWGRSFINPILALTRGTRALASGHLEERVIVDSTDELGQLGDAFNNMADKLVELQEDVRKKERQAMFGRIAAGLVHDLSHPIQNIGNSCKLIVKMFEDLEYRESFKRTVERELAQVKRVLDDLRNLARPLPLDKFPLDLNKALAGACRIDGDDRRHRRPHAGNGVRVRSALHRRRPVRAEPRLPEPDHQRVPGDRAARPRDHPHAAPGRRGDHRDCRHRLRHSAGAPRHDLRRLRHDQAPRPRPRPRDLEEGRRAAGRRDLGRQRGRPRQHVHAALPGHQGAPAQLAAV